MANVRIDAQGVPKAPVYEVTPPLLHRGGVTSPDAADPTTAGAGLSTDGYRFVRFDIDTTASTGLSALTVQLLVWNGAAGRYFRGAQRQFTAADLAANPIPSLEAEVRGATVFLKVVAATATSLNLNVYAALS
ncbi:MAG: hypothetical protein HYS09_03855 [Chloroflexi bacterium]|nr:hypothetical protein [Chloroflexota bacterium]